MATRVVVSPSLIQRAEEAIKAAKQAGNDRADINSLFMVQIASAVTPEQDKWMAIHDGVLASDGQETHFFVYQKIG